MTKARRLMGGPASGDGAALRRVTGAAGRGRRDGGVAARGTGRRRRSRTRGGVATAWVVAGWLAAPGALPAADQEPPPPTNAEDRLRQLEEEVGRLQEEVRRLEGSADFAERERVKQLEQQIEILSRELERQRIGPAAPPAASRPARGLGPAASKVYGVERGVSVGGYGEMLYQDPRPSRDDGAPSERPATLDFLRGVFYFGYKFNDRILFNSETEYEHAETGEGSEEKGEVALEFAYLDFSLREGFNVRAGLLLVPVGFLNELHEPPVYLGARRPEVEQLILPTTWRENGAGIFGDLGPVTYRVYLLAGLDAAGFSAATGLREGRQQGSQSLAEDLALTGRADWQVVPGLTLGASAFVGRSGQGQATPSGDVIGGRVEEFDLRAQWRWRGLQTRALFSRIDIGDAAEIDALRGLSGSDSVGARLVGWYLEAGYDVLSRRSAKASLVPYARYEVTRTQDRVPAGFAADPANDVHLWTAGIAYLPIPQVVLKVDYQDVTNAANTGVDQFNVALGFLF